MSEPPVGARHGRIVMRLGFLLETWSRRSAMGVVLAGDVGFLLARDPDTVRAPDIAFVTHGRYPSPSAERGPIPGPPDLAVEVLSPSERPAGIRAKLADYRNAGTTLVWVVDPDARHVRTYTASGAAGIVTSDDTLIAPDVLPGFAAPVSDIFGSA